VIRAGPDALVIGYGNPLHRDDGAGQRVAEAVAAWGRPGVRVLAVHQLTPEIAEDLAQAGCAIFVDARVTGAVADIEPLEPTAAAATLGHTSDPRALLALARALYGRCPPAWLVAVPGSDFGPGEGLSPAAARGLADALARVEQLLDGAGELGSDRCTKSG
jgi:hydrogenase maturation protease